MCKQIAYGETSGEARDGVHNASLPSALLNPHSASPDGIRDCRTWVHPTLWSESPTFDFTPDGSVDLIVAGTNDHVDDHNRACTFQLSHDVLSYKATDRIQCDDSVPDVGEHDLSEQVCYLHINIIIVAVAGYAGISFVMRNKSGIC